MISRINSPYQLGRLNQIAKRKAEGVSGWWLAGGINPADCLSAFQPKGAVSYVTSLLDLSGKGNDAVEGSLRDTSKWDAINGWEMYTNSDNTTLRTSHKGVSGMTGIVRFSNASGFFVFGISDRWEITPTQSGAVTYRNNNTVTISPAITSGILALTANKGYRNGVLDTASLGNRTDLANYYIGIGSRDGFNFNFLGHIQAIAFYSTTLTALQIAALTNAMNEL